ncbi:MAG: hypothetical protein IE937_09740 [Gammaproteobacteria bacterium]|nr:hypothetical protein [Gammaproteobacteria bacterium]
MTAPKPDIIDFIISVETDGFDPMNDDHRKGLQNLIDSGMIHHLQGSWQRLAGQMIRLGLAA